MGKHLKVDAVALSTFSFKYFKSAIFLPMINDKNYSEGKVA